LSGVGGEIKKNLKVDKILKALNANLKILNFSLAQINSWKPIKQESNNQV
jgi:hypothetical protein